LLGFFGFRGISSANRYGPLQTATLLTEWVPQWVPGLEALVSLLRFAGIDGSDRSGACRTADT
jgi:hypothetical protein